MTLFGGISFVVHGIVLIIRWIVKNPKSAVSMLMVTVFVSIGAVTSMRQSFSNSPNVAFVERIFSDCNVAQASDTHERSIILRLDDVQAFTWDDISIRMIDDITSRDMTTTIGVIPIGIEHDTKLVKYLKKKSCSIEIAQHGWDHGHDIEYQNPEFAYLNRDEAYERIMKGKELLEKTFGRPVDSFIPPNNVYTPETLEALKDAHISYLSSTFNAAPYAYNKPKADPTPVDKMIMACEKALDENGVCTIMLHPQDYSKDYTLDEKKYTHFTALLDAISKIDADVVTIKHYAETKHTK